MEQCRAMLSNLVTNQGHSIIIFAIPPDMVETMIGYLSNLKDGQGWATTVKLEVLPDDERAPEPGAVLEPCDCSCHGEESQGH